MMNLNLRQTVFQIEKCRNVVNVGRSSPYHIYTIPGSLIGHLGNAVSTSNLPAANDAAFATQSADEPGQPTPASWIKRTLAAFR